MGTLSHGCKRGVLAVFPFALLSVHLAACTIGARTPVLIPEQEGQAKPAATDEEENFDLPDAEAVSDGASQWDPPDPEAPPETKFETFTIGRARVGIGPRPPWASIEELETDDAPDLDAKVPSVWTLKKSITIGQGYIHQAEFAPDEQSVIALSTQNGHIYRYDLSGKLLQEVELPRFRQFDDAVFATMPEITERPQLIVARPTGTSVLDLESGQFDFLEYIPPGNGVAHTGRTGLYGISYRKINPQSGEIRFQWINGDIAAVLECSHRPDEWAMTSDGRYLAVSYYPADQVEILDLRERKLIGQVNLPKWGSAVAISPDRTVMAVGGEKLQIVRFPSGEVLAEDARFGNNIHEVRFTPQGDLLLVSAYDGKARSYALPKDLSTISSLPRPQSLNHLGQANVYALGLTKDGRMLVTSSGDKTIKIWRR